MQEYKAKYEINYPAQKIKIITPYLDKIEVPNNIKNGKKRYLNMRQRAFAWYYVHNMNSKADAYRRAYRGNYNKKLGVIEISDEVNNDNCTPVKQMDTVKGSGLFSKPYIRLAIKLIREENEKEFLTDVPQTMKEMLEIMATYDPSMFLKEDGSLRYNDLKKIPKKYRCCIEGIETKYYGKEADRKVVTIKLTDRKKAMSDLLKLLPDLVKPEKFEHLHKTIDHEGNEVGFDISKMSDTELNKRRKELKDKVKE